MTILFSVGGLVGDLSLEEQIIVAKQAGFDGIDYIASIKDLFFTPKKSRFSCHMLRHWRQM